MPPCHTTFFSDRRSQFLVAGSNVPSNSEASDFEDDEEAQIQNRRQRFLDEDDFEDNETLHAAIRDNSFVAQLNWDEDDDQVPKRISRREGILPANTNKVAGTLHTVTEQTALLAKTSRISFSSLPRPAVHDSQAHSLGDGPSYQTATSPPIRRMSSTSVRSASGLNHNFGGQSTYGQTVCQCIALCLY